MFNLLMYLPAQVRNLWIDHFSHSSSSAPSFSLCSQQGAQPHSSEPDPGAHSGNREHDLNHRWREDLPCIHCSTGSPREYPGIVLLHSL